MTSRTYAREIKRLIKQIPNDFPCIPGCTDCCTDHTWTWTEWWKVEPKLMAKSKDDKCPYVLPSGCGCYDQRPVICRLFGNSGIIGDFIKVLNAPRSKAIKDISLACPRGVQPKTPLPRDTARKIFMAHVEIIKKELNDLANLGRPGMHAGPFAPWAGR